MSLPRGLEVILHLLQRVFGWTKPLYDQFGPFRKAHSSNPFSWANSTGCAIYTRRPDPCAAWSCTWLYQPAAAVLKRPDIGGYAVDPMPQEILINGDPVMTIQVWCDPDRREAHRAPELRAYLDAMGRDTRMPAIVRWPNGHPQADQDALVLFPPSLTGGDWWEHVSAMIPEDAMRAKLKKSEHPGVRP